jgi:hypothetical protein
MTTSVEPETRAALPPVAAAVKPKRFAWLREVGIVIGFYEIYNLIRSFADAGGAKTRAAGNARRLVGWEQSLHIFYEQTIQQAFIDARWFIKLMNIYYGTLHFVITAVLLIWVYARRHHAYRRLRNLLGVTTGLALIGYWSFPLRPPRLYACNPTIPAAGPSGPSIGKCFVDTLSKVGGLWSYKSSVARVIANQYAAMPSLHFAWSLWCAVVLYQYSRHRAVRMFGLLYPFITLFAIVVTANHYFLDALGGAITIGAAVLVLRATERRRSARLLHPSAGDLAPAE